MLPQQNFKMSSESSFSRPKYLLMKTIRNGVKILYNRFLYVKDGSNGNNQHWRCQYRNCKGRLRTSPLCEITEIEEKGNHNHYLSDDEINKITLDQKIKELAETTTYPTNKIYSMATNTTNLHNLPIISKKLVYKKAG